MGESKSLDPVIEQCARDIVLGFWRPLPLQPLLSSRTRKELLLSSHRHRLFVSQSLRHSSVMNTKDSYDSIDERWAKTRFHWAITDWNSESDSFLPQTSGKPRSTRIVWFWYIHLGFLATNVLFLAANIATITRPMGPYEPRIYCVFVLYNRLKCHDANYRKHHWMKLSNINKKKSLRIYSTKAPS